MRVALALSAVVIAACQAAGSDPVTVLVASSLVDVAGDAVEAWGGGAAVSDAGSQVLRAQVESGAPADVVLLADPDIARGLEDDGLAGPAVELATTGLAIAVSPAAESRVADPRDLADPDLVVVLADEVAPLGAYTRTALDRLEDSGAAPERTAQAVLDGADSFEDAARLVLAKVTTGAADAAVVYRTDVLAAQRAGHDVRLVAWPPAADVRAAYTGQVVLRGRTARARDLLAFVASPAAADVWRRHGFDPVAAALTGG